MIPGDLLSACPNRQFHILPGLLDSRAALTNSNPNALRAMQAGRLYHFYDGLWYDPHVFEQPGQGRDFISKFFTWLVVASSVTLLTATGLGALLATYHSCEAAL